MNLSQNLENDDLLQQVLARLTEIQYEAGSTGSSEFTPRSYQLPVLQALEKGVKRACLVWHRRAGKDLTMLTWINKCVQTRGGVFFHLFPSYAQGKKVVWDGLTGNGRRFLSYFSRGSIARMNETELKITFKNGSVYMIVGTDNYNSILGTNPSGLVFSEYSLQNPAAWKFLSPILLENRGWAVFISTPRGRNHFYDLYQTAKDDPSWFCQHLSIDDTKREDGSPVIDREEVRKEVLQGVIDEETAQQEYWCSWTSPMSGAYYARLLESAEKEGRITGVPWNPSFLVSTFFDIGISDSTAIWFVQQAGREIHIVDFYENHGQGIDHYAKVLREKDYVYEAHYLPFDAESRELGTGKCIREMLENLKVKPCRIVPRVEIQTGIVAARAIIPRCWFDSIKCKAGIQALQNYRSEFDEKRKSFSESPLHDWSSHAADAFRYLALGFRESGRQSTIKVETDFDIFQGLNDSGRRGIKIEDVFDIFGD